MKPEASIDESARPQRRPSEDGPFVWQATAALERLHGAFDKGLLPHARALYLALTELAGEAKAATFTAFGRDLSSRSGVSLRMVWTLLDRLKELGLITWETTPGPMPKSHGPHRYTLLRMYPADYDAKTPKG